MTQNHTNAHKPLTCPQCGSQNLTISQKLIYGRYFSIEDGKMFRMTDPKIETHGDTWIDCIECRQDSDFKDGPKECEWIASKEEEELIWQMREKASEPINVSEFLEGKEK